ncbi:hypothetical protein ERO13_D09G101101v2 [Gossypium hirsutum]|nr:hypothetical protein ERO13_D09G101101v2 [Gossypium hirsutum]
MNYLHKHKPKPIVHNNLDPRNLLQDESGHLKIGEYWVQMLYEQIQPNQDASQINEICDTKKDVRAFGFILYQMLEGRQDINFDYINLNFVDFEIKFPISRCPKGIQELIQKCTSNDPPQFTAVIGTLEDVSISMRKTCIIGQYCV